MKIIKPYFEHQDERGSIKGIVNTGEWKEINFITSEKGSVRGNHLHHHTTELIYILSGTCNLSVKHEGESVNVTLNANEGVVITPGEFHSIEALEEVHWINALSTPMDKESPDIHSM